MSMITRIRLFEITKINLSLFKRCMSSLTLETLNFENKILKSLPIDENKDNEVKQVKGACYSKVKPTPVSNPNLVAFSESALNLIDLPVHEVSRKEFVEYFSGNLLLPGSVPLAHCYCGHQFGYFAGQLGDGAAITLGDVVNQSKEIWEIQLKGAGLTPYSRTADGRKVLRSSLREFLCSEAMHFLNVPTTRASSIITSESTVVRDIFYDGHPILENCSIVCRLAPTFIRFGSFQICKGSDRTTGSYGPSVAHPYLLNQLADFVIENFYPKIWESFKENKESMYAEFFREVVRRTARLVAHWQSIGWCHGVLNTDNMSILGLTIDYGPYGFMDHYDPDYICNASDTGGRYTYKNQPSICKWNCEILAESLQVITNMTYLKKHLDDFDNEFKRCYLGIMRKKIGLLTVQDSDKELIESLLTTMQKTFTDFTNTFICLGQLCISESSDSFENIQFNVSSVKQLLLQQCSTVEELKVYYRPRMDPNQLSQLKLLMQSDPAIHHLLTKQKGQIAVEMGRMEQFDHLNTLTEEAKRNRDDELWGIWLDKYTSRLKQEHCYPSYRVVTNEGSSVDGKEDDSRGGGGGDSSDVVGGGGGGSDVGGGGDGGGTTTTAGSVNVGMGKDFIKEINNKRRNLMDSVNPKFILRNYIAQQAIQAAENGDYTAVNKLLKRLEKPYDDHDDGDDDYDIDRHDSDQTNSNMPEHQAANSFKENCGVDVTFNNIRVGDSNLCHHHHRPSLKRPPKWAYHIKVT